MSKKVRNYIDWLKKENGIMDDDEFLLDKDFLSDMVNEIERCRAERLVYDDEYKKYWLNEYLKRKRKKEVMKNITEKVRLKKEKQNSLN